MTEEEYKRRNKERLRVFLVSHKRTPPLKGYSKKNEVCSVYKVDGTYYAKFECFEYVYQTQKLTSKETKDHFLQTLKELSTEVYEVQLTINQDTIKIATR